MLSLIAIKSNDGIYISSLNNKYLETYLYDGKEPKGTFQENWYFLNKVPTSITKKVRQEPINKRYELIDKKQFPNLKPTYKQKEVKLCDHPYSFCDCENMGLTKEFYKIHSLYEHKQDIPKPINKQIEFEIDILAKINKLKEPGPFSFEVQATEWKSDGTKKIGQEEIRHNILDKIITPEILLHTKPCELSSKDSYDIIRQYVNDNIDSRYAEITSDFNFCFTVKKKIKLAEKEYYKVDINNSIFQKRSKKPKIVTRFKDDRLVEIFEMTHAQEAYKGYSVLDGFKGNNVDDLNNNIKNYLENLIKKINEPLEDCKHCKGKGVVLEKEEEIKS